MGTKSDLSMRLALSGVAGVFAASGLADITGRITPGNLAAAAACSVWSFFVLKKSFPS